MPDNGIRTMCKSQANPCFPTIFSFIDLFHEKRQAMYGSTSYQHRADPNVPAEGGGVDRRRLDERGRGVTPERVRGQCGNHPQGPRRMHADGCMHRRFRSPPLEYFRRRP